MNAVFNEQVAGQLIEAGKSNPTFIWVAVGLVLLQVLIIPLTVFLWKQQAIKEEKRHRELTEANNKIAQLETEKRKKARDQEIKDLKTDFENKMQQHERRISDVEKDFKNQVEKLVDSSERQSKTLEKLFEKFDKLSEKFDNFIKPF